MVTAEEEFGIAAVESLASGRPVIALRAGGVLETVTEGVTGAFYDDGDDPDALAAAVARLRCGAGRPGGVRRVGADGSASSASRSGCAPSSRRRARARRPARIRTSGRAVYYPADRHAEAPNP